MDKVKILGICGSPRRDGNTAKMVEKALEGACSVPDVEAELYQLAGKKVHHCISCYKCLETGECVFKDDLQEFLEMYLPVDGVIWGAPVYHINVPASMKALLDRMGNLILCHFLNKGEMMPRFSKACGVVTTGGHRYGGQDLVLSFLIGSCLMENNVVVSGDSVMGSYLGAASFSGGGFEAFAKDNVLNDHEGLMCAQSVGKRVAETACIIKAGKEAIKEKLPAEYDVRW